MGIVTAGYAYENILLSLELEVRKAMKAKPTGKPMLSERGGEKEENRLFNVIWWFKSVKVM